MESKNNIILAPMSANNLRNKNWAESGMIMMNHEARSSTRYMFSVGNKDNELLLSLKRKCAAHNKYIREMAYKYEWDMNDSWITLMRVSLKARGPRAIHAKAIGYHPRSFDQALPHEFARYFDVYYHKDTYNNWVFNCKKEEKIALKQLESELDEMLTQEKAKDLLIAKIKELKCKIK